MADPKLLFKVRQLIAQADNTTFPEEADAFRKKADALMLQYSISEFELKSESSSSRAVDTRDFDMMWYKTSPWNSELYSIFGACAKHCRVKIVTWKYTGAYIPVVGTDADLDFFDMLFTGIMREMSNGIEPKPREGESMIDYLVRGKEAGMKWERIGDIMVGAGIADFDEYTRNIGVRFTKMYTDYCTEHERVRLRVSPGVYQRSFVLGFSSEIVHRLYRLRQENIAEYDASHEAEGAGLVLASIEKLVESRAHEIHGHPPMERYASRGGYRRTPERKTDPNAMQAGRERARSTNLGNTAVGTSQRKLGSGS